MFRIRQILKMLLQNVFLPVVYWFYARRPVRKGFIIFADGHHEELPFSMRRVYEALAGGDVSGQAGQAAAGEVSGPAGQTSAGNMGGRAGQAAAGDWRRPAGRTSDGEPCSLMICVRDLNRMSYGELARYLLWFMKQYAMAEYVFICDYYLPVAACRRRPETTVVQLWHSCGLMKKIAHDAPDDIPKGYRGDMFGNYSWLTLSAQVCVPVHARALRIPEERIRATGVSRTDYYFDEEWNRRCVQAFYDRYPQAAGRRIALWAPTFRGNAASPELAGLQEIRQAAELLSDEWYFLIKAHPHIDAHGVVSNCTIPTEELLPVADLLITDYSSILFDFLLYRRPVVLFAPDLERYEQGRGFYVDYREIPFPLAQTVQELVRAVREAGRSVRKAAAAQGRAAEGSAEEKKAERSHAIGESAEERETVQGRTTDGSAEKKEAERSRTADDGMETTWMTKGCTAGSSAEKSREIQGRTTDGMPQEDEAVRAFREKYVGACDGHATERILALVGLR